VVEYNLFDSTDYSLFGKISRYKEDLPKGGDLMPNIKSAEKRVQIAEARRIKNAAIKSKVKTVVKKYTEVLQSGDKEQAQKLLVNAIRTIDKATTKGVIHKNAAARKKSGLQKLYNQVNAG
jgi:small subunit ribosomal protein S20